MTFPQSLTEAVREQGGVGGGALAVTTPCHMHNFKEPLSTVSPAGWPGERAGRGHVSSERVCGQCVCVEDNNYYLLLNVRVRFRALIVRRPEARGL